MFIQPSKVWWKWNENGLTVFRSKEKTLKKKNKLTEYIYWRCYGQHERKSKLLRPCPSMMMKIMTLSGWLMNFYPKHFLSFYFIFSANTHFKSKPLLFNENIIHDFFLWEFIFIYCISYFVSFGFESFGYFFLFYRLLVLCVHVLYFALKISKLNSARIVYSPTKKKNNKIRFYSFWRMLGFFFIDEVLPFWKEKKEKLNYFSYFYKFFVFKTIIKSQLTKYISGFGKCGFYFNMCRRDLS